MSAKDLYSLEVSHPKILEEKSCYLVMQKMMNLTDFVLQSKHYEMYGS